MSGLKLPLFPVDSTAVSMTITVWLGVCVVTFFNLRFGWSLSGLVVPGYLVPLLLVEPTSVAIIFGQAVLTYLIVRSLSDVAARLPCWCSLFGRDRFFAILLVSVLVRAATDVWLLPRGGRWLQMGLGVQEHDPNFLNSFGLVIVALLANAFWKPRLFRGLVTSLITLGLTFLLFNYVVLGLTNFSLGDLNSLYDDMSASLLSTPKAYIILITTAFVASWLNLRYRWDFNGILVPALLALLWHEPAKLAVSVAESVWVLFLGSCALRLPVWGQTTIEGARKLLLFFTLAAVHRLVLAHVLLWSGDWHITDAYGFGYLLTTLMAVKAHDTKAALRVYRATLQASMVGAVAASFIGFALASLPSQPLFAPAPPGVSEDKPVIASNDVTIRQVINEQRVQLYAMKLPGSYRAPGPHKIDAFRDGVQAALHYAEGGRTDDLQRAAERLARADYRISIVEQRYLVLTEREPVDGGGTFVLNRQASGNLLIEVPAPLEEWATIDAGLVLFETLRARALAIAGAARRSGDDGSSDTLGQTNTVMAAFHAVVDRGDTLQVRGDQSDLVSDGRGMDTRATDESLDSGESDLHVKHSLPPSLDLAALKRIVPSARIQWKPTRTANVLRDATPRGFAELILSRQDRRRLQYSAVAGELTATSVLAPHEGGLNHWLSNDRLTLAREGSNEYRTASVAEMLYLDQEVLTPLVRLACDVTRFDQLADVHRASAGAIGEAASILNYRLLLFRDLTSGGDYFVLSESHPKRRHWGTYVLRAGMQSPFLVEVPRPLYEQQTHPFGVDLLQRSGAAALLIAGAHPLANTDGTSDVAQRTNKVNAFQLVRQVILRELHEKPMVVVQARAIPSPVEADMLIATDDGAATLEQLSPPVRRLYEQWTSEGLTARLVDGSEDTAGYEFGLLLQAESLNHSTNKQMIALWLSPSLRREYHDPEFLEVQDAKFRAVGVPTIDAELYEHLKSLGATSPDAQLDPAAISTVERFCDNSDVVSLHRLVRQWPHYNVTRVRDTGTGQAFLLVQPHGEAIPWVFNLSATPHAPRQTHADLTADVVRQFARERHFLLQWKRLP